MTSEPGFIDWPWTLSAENVIIEGTKGEPNLAPLCSLSSEGFFPSGSHTLQEPCELEVHGGDAVSRGLRGIKPLSY